MAGSKSSTSSQVVTQNQQVGASEGAVAAGAGATVNIQNLSGEVTRDALSAVVAQGARSSDAVTDVATTAVTAIRGTAGDALSTGERTTREALGFGRNATDQVFEFASEFLKQSERTQQGIQNFARQSSELVAAGAGVTSPAAVQDTINSFVKLVAIAGLAGFFIVNRKR